MWRTGVAHSCTVTSGVCQIDVLAAIHRDHLAGDGARLQKIAHRGADIGGLGAVAERGRVALAVEILLGLARVDASVGPGPTALTRMRGASACARVVVSQ